MEFVRAEGKKLVAGEKLAAGGGLFAGGAQILLRGFGLGGWLLPEGYMWQFYTKCDRPRRIEQMLKTLCGEDYAASFWDRYLNTFITEEDIRWIADEGFNCVRLPLNARHLYSNQNGKFILIPAMLRRIDDLIEWCRRYGVYVILDMHAAPGGQTGQNIDDSEDDMPGLFMDKANRYELCQLWHDIAERYADEPTIAGYDLLNEPLPKQFEKYNDLVLPLYKELCASIRQVDTHHIIILEGVHWATDFSIFDSLEKGEIDSCVLQFHKYWNTPDAESLAPYLACADRFCMPLLMGEGGENNLAWYTTVFPLYENHGISWSFWTYKKMGKDNSPVTFERPAGWDSLIAWFDGREQPTPAAARIIFDDFLYAVQHFKRNESVIKALKREVPLVLPCEAYDGYIISSVRRPGAVLRMCDPVTLFFANGKTGAPDYRRYDGEQQPEEENIIAELITGESLSYRLVMPQEGILCAYPKYSGDGGISFRVDNSDMHPSKDDSFRSDILNKGEHKLHMICTVGVIQADTISLSILESGQLK